MSILLLLISGCEQVVNVDLPIGYKKLVVEGWITDQQGHYFVKLTQTRDYSFSYNDTLIYEKKATVFINDDLGNEWHLSEIADGFYMTDGDVKGEIGRSYSLNIKTTDGREYKSKPEIIRKVPSIDSIYTMIDETELSENGTPVTNIVIDFQDPQQEENNYLWLNYYNGRQGNGFSYFSDKYFNGQQINGFSVDGIYGPVNYKFKVQQLSISKEAYQFWSLLDIQTDDIGTQYDPPPTPIIGNIYNVNDPEDYALGYFGAYGVSEAELN